VISIQNFGSTNCLICRLVCYSYPKHDHAPYDHDLYWIILSIEITNFIGIVGHRLSKICSLYVYCRYHMGSVAFGSLLIAICQLIRIILEYLDRKLKGSENPVAKCFVK